MEAQVLDNPIERERHHHQGAVGVAAPHREDGAPTSQLHRHARPRRLQLRGQPLARRLRGALLVVDAAQGVEAQSVANRYTAVEQGLEVVPILNKIDLPTADIDRAKGEIEAVIGIDAADAVAISAKTGMNVPDVLEAIVQRIPPPQPRDTDKPGADHRLRGSTTTSAWFRWCA